MRLFHESLRFDRALFLLRTLFLVIWRAEIEVRSVEIDKGLLIRQKRAPQATVA